MPFVGSRSRSFTTIVAAVVVGLVPYLVATPAGAQAGATWSAGLTTCLDESPKLVVQGAQSTGYRNTLDTATAVDAGSARWSQLGATPVSIGGTGGLCWTGGVIEGTYPATTKWSTFTATGAFSVSNPAATVDNLRVHDYGDGIRLLGGASDWMVRGAFETVIHDDCIANDKLNGGVVSQSLLDGCFTGFSARPRTSDTTSDGSHRTVTVTGSLIRLQPMASVPSGVAAPGTGGFFDWDSSGRAPSLDLHNNVFRADRRAGVGTLALPAHTAVTCSGNTIVWRGPGTFPGTASWKARCPDTRIVTSATVWSSAVTKWKNARTGGGTPTTTTTTTAPPTTTTTTAAPTTTTTSGPTTTTTPASDPGSTSACLGPRASVVSGPQTTRYKPELTTATAVDARTASWVQVDDWPVSITGTAPLCWYGGSIIGTYPDTTLWTTFHSTGAFNVANPDSIVERVRIHDYGDGIRLREGASHWTVRGADESYLHDDCLENDRLYTGTIADSLFDGCYVAFSARPSSSDTTSDGRTHTVTLDHNLVRLQPMPTTYKGPAPGTGGFFKWDDTGRSPALSLHDNVFRADQLPNHGSLGLPDGYAVSCSGNTIVWLGAGAVPEAASWRAKCPDTRIVTDRAVWDAAVTAWRAAH